MEAAVPLQRPSGLSRVSDSSTGNHRSAILHNDSPPWIMALGNLAHTGDDEALIPGATGPRYATEGGHVRRGHRVDRATPAARPVPARAAQRPAADRPGRGRAARM